eukprot:1161274-Pelagomonas_calceolata.AAC.8
MAGTWMSMLWDLDEHAVVSRVMRKDNYLIALINKGVLRLAPPPLVPTLTVALRGAAGEGWAWHLN